jgi:hypothetical protein
MSDLAVQAVSQVAGSYLPTEAPATILFSMGLPKSIGTILIDAFEDEDHHSVVTVTTSPVEDGSTISDNAIEEPDELIINGIVGAASILNPISSLSSLASGRGSLSSFISRPLDVDQALYALKHARQPIQVVTGLRVYQNMVITDYRVKRNKDTGGALHFTAYLKQIIIVQSQTTSVPASQLGGSTTAVQQATDGVAGGNQGTTTPSANIQAMIYKDPILSGQQGAAAGASAADQLFP